MLPVHVLDRTSRLIPRLFGASLEDQVCRTMCWSPTLSRSGRPPARAGIFPLLGGPVQKFEESQSRHLLPVAGTSVEAHRSPFYRCKNIEIPYFYELTTVK